MLGGSIDHAQALFLKKIFISQMGGLCDHKSISINCAWLFLMFSLGLSVAVFVFGPSAVLGGSSQ